MGNNNNPFSARRERGCRAVYIMNMNIMLIPDTRLQVPLAIKEVTVVIMQT